MEENVFRLLRTVFNRNCGWPFDAAFFHLDLRCAFLFHTKNVTVMHFDVKKNLKLSPKMVSFSSNKNLCKDHRFECGKRSQEAFTRISNHTLQVLNTLE